MLNKPILLVLTLIFCSPSNGITQKYSTQDYSRYYSAIDSADFFYHSKDYLKAEELYSRSLTYYLGFPTDYLKALVNYYKLKKSINENYLMLGYATGLHYKEIFFKFISDSIPFKKSHLKKEYRRYRQTPTVNIAKLKKLIKKDQKFRRHWNPEKFKELLLQDSLNAVALFDLYKSDPKLFDRIRTGRSGESIITVILIHQHWDNIKLMFPALLELVKKGKMARFNLQFFLERNTIHGGYCFELDSTLHTLVGKKTDCDTICGMNYSLFGDYIYSFSGASKKVLVPPDPKLTAEQLDQIRSVIFLSSLDLFKETHPEFQVVTGPEFCDMITKLPKYHGPTKYPKK